MKRIVLMMALLVFSVSSCAIPRGGSTFRSAGYVVGDARFGSRGSWKPTDEQIAQLEEKLGRLMAMPDRRVKFSSIGEQTCPFPLSEYAMCYHGEIIRGREVVVGKATHKSQSPAGLILNPTSVPAYEVLLEAFGGGEYFFTVTYDVTSREIVALQYNALL